MSNSHGGCALLLLFLSDGRPSDRVPKGARGNTLSGYKAVMQDLMGRRIGALASSFGRRLTVATVGFGRPGEDFCVLETMASVAREYGSNGTFQSASLTADSLGKAFSSLTSSLTDTKAELTALKGAGRRTVRNVQREVRDLVDGPWVTESWSWYQRHVRRVVWSAAEGWAPRGFMTGVARGVAMRKCVFGEGAERMVRKFREVGAGGWFVGPELVAKESRFIEDLNDEDLKVWPC